MWLFLLDSSTAAALFRTMVINPMLRRALLTDLAFSGVVFTASQYSNMHILQQLMLHHVLGAEIEDRLEARLSVNWSTESR